MPKDGRARSIWSSWAQGNRKFKELKPWKRIHFSDNLDSWYSQNHEPCNILVTKCSHRAARKNHATAHTLAVRDRVLVTRNDKRPSGSKKSCLIWTLEISTRSSYNKRTWSSIYQRLVIERLLGWEERRVRSSQQVLSHFDHATLVWTLQNFYAVFHSEELWSRLPVAFHIYFREIGKGHSKRDIIAESMVEEKHRLSHRPFSRVHCPNSPFGVTSGRSVAFSSISSILHCKCWRVTTWKYWVLSWRSETIRVRRIGIWYTASRETQKICEPHYLSIEGCSCWYYSYAPKSWCDLHSRQHRTTQAKGTWSMVYLLANSRYQSPHRCFTQWRYMFRTLRATRSQALQIDLTSYLCQFVRFCNLCIDVWPNPSGATSSKKLARKLQTICRWERSSLRKLAEKARWESSLGMLAGNARSTSLRKLARKLQANLVRL